MPLLFLGVFTLIGAALVYFLSQGDAEASVDISGDSSEQTVSYNFPDLTFDFPQTLLPDFSPEEYNVRPVNPDTNIIAFLTAIKTAEGSPGYNTLFGYGVFDSFAEHPNVRVPFHNPLRSGSGNNDFSTAAGAYQINKPTYNGLSAKLGLTDFSPATQDAMAIELIREKGALEDVRAGRFATAIQKVSGVWASLPGSTAKQSKRSYEYVALAFTNAGGVIV